MRTILLLNLILFSVVYANPRDKMACLRGEMNKARMGDELILVRERNQSTGFDYQGLAGKTVQFEDPATGSPVRQQIEHLQRLPQEVQAQINAARGANWRTPKGRETENHLREAARSFGPSLDPKKLEEDLADFMDPEGLWMVVDDLGEIRSLLHSSSGYRKTFLGLSDGLKARRRTIQEIHYFRFTESPQPFEKQAIDWLELESTRHPQIRFKAYSLPFDQDFPFVFVIGD